ncbi:MAG: diaminopimelate epimerase [Oscillospiraceae bacterium]|nr:diaminopimelate epimerase [Oscillospiraceae bacterium]
MQAWYMSGAGNDFMVIDARGLTLDFSAMAKKLCAEANCDGFMAVDHSETADFKLHFYNADGSRGEMCGNGSRCVSKFAFDNGIAPADMTIETDAGLLTSTRISENQYRVKLNNPGIVDLHRHGDMAYVELGNPGVPHGVFRYPGLAWEMRDELRERMRSERFADYFPKGANVNYYDILEEGRVRILTFERGVEDFTLACGTGSGSVAAVLWLTGQLPGGCVAVENPGGTLTFTLKGEQGQITELLMTGPAEVLEIKEV